jgi:hypothetical protein
LFDTASRIARIVVVDDDCGRARLAKFARLFANASLSINIMCFDNTNNQATDE